MKTVTLEVEEEPGSEIVVRVSDVPVADLYDLNTRAASIPRDLEEFRAMAEKFAPFLVSWTFGATADADGLMTRDYGMVMGIIGGWIQGVVQAPPPLLRRSSDGGQSPSEDPR